VPRRLDVLIKNDLVKTDGAIEVDSDTAIDRLKLEKVKPGQFD